MTLYEIDERVMECVDEETGEIVDFDKLSELQMQSDKKIENIGCYIKNLLAEAKMIEEEEKVLSKRRRACKNKAESYKQYLSNYLNGRKFKTAKVSISYRKSDSINIDDPGQVPRHYFKYADPTVNKTKAREDIKAGKTIPGITLETKYNIQIK